MCQTGTTLVLPPRAPKVYGTGLLLIPSECHRCFQALVRVKDGSWWSVL